MLNLYNIIFILFIVAVFSIGGTSVAYGAESLSFDQDELVIDHGVRVVFTSDADYGSEITAEVVGSETKLFTLYRQNSQAPYEYISNHFWLISDPSSSSDQIQVEVGGNIEVSLIEVNIDPISETISSGEENLDEYDPRARYRIGFKINSCADYGNDTDNDGVCDDWENQDTIKEIFGQNAAPGLYVFEDTQNVPPSEYYFYPCDTCTHTKADLFVEIDSMKGHKPSQYALRNISESFLNSPYQQASSESGIQIHFQVSDTELPHVDFIPVPSSRRDAGFDSMKLVWFGSSGERGFQPPTPSNYWSGTQRDLKAQVFHYVLMAHDTTNDPGASGWAEMPGNDAVVTLGSYDYSVGNDDQQAGTLMHELGHNLNLSHGGSDGINCKPNYLSVMSYSRQFEGLVVNRPLDFSHMAVSPIPGTGGELGDSDPNNLSTVYSDAQEVIKNATTGNLEELLGSSASPINHIPIFEDCPGSTATLSGYDDWSNVELIARSSSSWTDGLKVTVDEENDPDRKGRHVSGDKDYFGGPEDKPKGCIFVKVPPRDPTQDRTCILDNYDFTDVHEQRKRHHDNIHAHVSELIPIGSDPRPGDPLHCLDLVRQQLEELRDNSDITPAEAKLRIEEMMEKFDGVGDDDCKNITNDDKKRIFSQLLKSYEIYSTAVPEFETLTILVLSASVVTVIFLTSRTRLSFSVLNR